MGPYSSKERPRVRGKFFFIGAEKLYLRGATYGTFHPDETGNEYGSRVQAERDLSSMTAEGINAIRVYTVPPSWLLDIALRNSIWVLVGLPWEQHVTFLDDDRRPKDIELRIRERVRECKGHPAVLGYTIGNEIPGDIIRWHGRRRIERFIRRLYRAAKSEDPDGLVSYVNYPTTEYLQLPFLDFACFNVFLEQQDRLDAYLARLHNISGDQPLVLGEIGLDSERHGSKGAAISLDWQIRSLFASGCAGGFVFSWTDEWHRGGHDVDDRAFGLTTRDRRPKPALESVSKAFREIPFADIPPPPISKSPSLSAVTTVTGPLGNASSTLRS